MAVPLTSDLPGTSTEAGGDIQARSEPRRPPRLVPRPHSRWRTAETVSPKTSVRAGRVVTPVTRGGVPESYAAYPPRRIGRGSPRIRSRDVPSTSGDRSRNDRWRNRWTRSTGFSSPYSSSSSERSKRARGRAREARETERGVRLCSRLGRYLRFFHTWPDRSGRAQGETPRTGLGEHTGRRRYAWRSRKSSGLLVDDAEARIMRTYVSPLEDNRSRSTFTGAKLPLRDSVIFDIRRPCRKKFTSCTSVRRESTACVALARRRRRETVVRAAPQPGAHKCLEEGGPEMGTRAFEWALSRDKRREECPALGLVSSRLVVDSGVRRPPDLKVCRNQNRRRVLSATRRSLSTDRDCVGTCIYRCDYAIGLFVTSAAINDASLSGLDGSPEDRIIHKGATRHYAIIASTAAAESLCSRRIYAKPPTAAGRRDGPKRKVNGTSRLRKVIPPCLRSFAQKSLATAKFMGILRFPHFAGARRARSKMRGLMRRVKDFRYGNERRSAGQRYGHYNRDRATGEGKGIATGSIYHILLADNRTYTCARRPVDIGGVNELSRSGESRSYTPWPHLQRISSYSRDAEGRDTHGDVRTYKMLSPDMATCTSCSLLGKRNSPDKFHRYVITGTAIGLYRTHRIQSRGEDFVRSYSRESIKKKKEKRGRRPPSIGCEKPDSLFREREGEPEIRHVSRYMNALLITCRKSVYCPGLQPSVRRICHECSVSVSAKHIAVIKGVAIASLVAHFGEVLAMIRCKISQESVGGARARPVYLHSTDPRTDIFFQNLPLHKAYQEDVLGNASDTKDTPIELEIPR
ncbi:hypothetical protein DBV15_00551 [Temnothorax longispinosus]|uniref:Uncharacterized protein n=1 Tax=Temnothorax longispinosus TaxID=300112 RepID=A0A4S2KXU3_9HYME|nr:hypothetical protein DBV15_00551 [Temnothorax longispinosus]